MAHIMAARQLRPRKDGKVLNDREAMYQWLIDHSIKRDGGYWVLSMALPTEEQFKKSIDARRKLYRFSLEDLDRAGKVKRLKKKRTIKKLLCKWVCRPICYP